VNIAIAAEKSEQAKRAYEASLATVSVCIPSGDTVKTDFAISLINLLMRSGRGTVVYSLANKQSCYIDLNRNLLVVSTIEHGKKYILFIDTDMTVPPDLGEKLVAHGKDIVGCDYGRRYEPYDRCGRTLDGLELGATGLREMESLGAGAMLISTEVFKRLEPPWFYNDYAVPNSNGVVPLGEDRTFCRNARAAGYQVWCDQELSRQVSHYGGMHLRIK
jgi:hypothetical protein